MAKSKLFRAFVEGNTISDGRKITAEMIDQIVETFNVDTYSPRINIEHIAGFSPEPPFNGYGDVIAVKAQTDGIVIDGKTEQRRALYAQVDGNDQLVDLAAKGQKPFPSVEITDSYAGTGKVGLIGLAFTDTPASIATQPLKFSRTAPGTVFAAGDAGVALEFEAAPADQAGILGSIKGLLDGFAAKFAAPEGKKEPKEEPAAPPAPANDNEMAAFARSIGDTVAQAIGVYAQANDTKVEALGRQLTELTTKLEATEQPGFNRQPASGGTGGTVTDC